MDHLLPLKSSPSLIFGLWASRVSVLDEVEVQGSPAISHVQPPVKWVQVRL